MIVDGLPIIEKGMEESGTIQEQGETRSWKEKHKLNTVNETICKLSQAGIQKGENLGRNAEAIVIA